MLAAHQASAHYGARKCLHGIDLQLRAGSVHALLGANGSGKSSLLKLLAGGLAPSSGSVQLDGRALADYSPQQLAMRRAVLPQHDALRFALNVREVLSLARLHLPRQSEVEAATLLDDCLEFVDAGALRNRNFLELSGGERARIHLARCLAQIWGAAVGAKHLLLDEPIAALDIAHQHLCLHRLRGWARQHDAGVLLVLHDLNLAARYADTLSLMQGGRIIASGAPAAVLTAEHLESAFGRHLRFVVESKPDGLQIAVRLATEFAAESLANTRGSPADSLRHSH